MLTGLCLFNWMKKGLPIAEKSNFVVWLYCGLALLSYGYTVYQSSIGLTIKIFCNLVDVIFKT